jgi:hypothetical protein
MAANPITLTEIHDEQLKSIRELRKAVTQMTSVLHILIGAAYLGMAAYGLAQRDFYPVMFAPAFLLISVLMTWAHRYIDRQLDLLESNDRPLDPHERDCFEQLVALHPTVASELFPRSGPRRGRDLKLLSRSVPQ